ncbi:MAG: sigma-70 family RNA polymerase sigma factor [Bacillati bacterium ANGP1]|uniref:Sigma-70 family RNA polymerase sigma factor n=1 Tax=Candidatus Segetimicrobium genomatis TaxID=2569760 RepID=A0A537JUX3_9BACT|nr:MAG: sigma-70 family RNA polymerase sigma factor [Terrabacteria group bacterium ANGP1]
MPSERPRWGWRREARGARSGPEHAYGADRDALEASDEELMQRLAAGGQEALGPLYSRYAARIFSMASHTLDRAAAEEIVQDVFLSVWRNAGTFAPDRGAFRPWVFQIAHYRILNELRHKSRQPQIEPDPEGLRTAGLPDPAPHPDEAAGLEEERAAVRKALNALPPAQREALNLAFFEDLTHEQVAAKLQVPLGTTKTRIRTGLQRLRVSLSPVAAALMVAAIGLGGLGLRYVADQRERALDARALALLTSSETVAIRLTAAPGVPAEVHAVYRGQAGMTVAVLTLDRFPPAPAGQTYQAWVRHGEQWTSLGTVRPDARGNGRLIVEGPELAVPPDAIEVTREPSGGSPVPSGPVVVGAPPAR